MTPAARVAAAIEVLDGWLAGGAAEQLLTSWARSHRFAGSTDRAAIRDLVYDAIRCRRSYAALGGGESGRALMIGAERAAGRDPAEIFTGEGYAPAAFGPGDAPPRPDLSEEERLDCPDWLAPQLRASLGADFAPVMEALRHRAPVFLRVNLARIDRDEAIGTLAQEGITARPHPLSPSALEVTEGARRIQQGAAYASGLVELQDAASQAVVDALAISPGDRVLDYCAGGGGKSLALAAQGAEVSAHDIDPRRMSDLPGRAARAGVTVGLLPTDRLPGGGSFDLIFADAPCSGSGAWRRSPQGKWDLTARRLDELCAIQAGILDEIVRLSGPDTRIGYATCSVIEAENGAQVAAFLARHPGWQCSLSRSFTPRDGGDGFFIALLTQRHE
ncbi:RsmB/NOP family class I SAM-dependent RNA methyltransferase [Sinisalibacter aestuarii]|uniref:SAM-dependent methyltransferase n=1 Tax=Sinisalibacter aestuarii TaxID=2949426 RepID=A0ABQ5LZD6_9RHOB|nr:RsmB/NOP family class I SAM-dependent RNA methyltransferase [Sinisalibacter aestuarii]GKY89800.1 SAM-dependent methyltransferase [Sinisalibacter aestuarii]